MANIDKQHDGKHVWVSVPVRALPQVLDLAEQSDGAVDGQDEDAGNREALVRELYSQVTSKTREMMDYLADRPGVYVSGLETAHAMGLGKTAAQMNSYNSARERLGISPEVIEAKKLTPGQWWFRVGKADAVTIHEVSASYPIVERPGA